MGKLRVFVWHYAGLSINSYKSPLPPEMGRQGAYRHGNDKAAYGSSGPREPMV